MSQHYLVTGGAGFIGSHVVSRLLSAGCRVTVVDNLSSGRRDNIPQHPDLRFVRADIARVSPGEIGNNIDGIVHLAAIPSVSASWDSPLPTHEVNLSNTLRVIKLAQALSCGRIVFASSAAVYGDTDRLPIREDGACRPISPYGLQKLASEHYLELFAAKAKTQAVALRLFNVFGPRQRPESEYSGVISVFGNAVLNDRPIHIFGDGEQTRDFVYVEDVAQAFHLALVTALARSAMLTCNIGLGQQTSINQLAQLLGRAAGSTAGVAYEPARQGDIRHSLADTQFARKQLGFVPEFAVEQGLRELLAALRPETGILPSRIGIA